ncbi:intercellular adhesion molecule 1 [Castor canadensis]|uniref:Intercellular adhesion molecule 1 n=1 Tax=Castor canadensis TaxID=51338 RepID=A0A8C0WP80_CASCN|nr:intercellular adhesion molecule 1 [Castor canadensis]
MAPTRAQPALPLLLLALTAVLLPGPGGARTSVHPPEAILPRGGSIQVNCSASCATPLMLGLETQLPKVEVDSGDNWKLFELSDIQEDSSPICFSDCGHDQETALATITVYWFPEVQLAPLPPWHPVGDNLTLRCLVTGGAPRARLSAVLLRGEEELSPRRPVVGEPAEVTATLLAGRGDHGANFSCRTELDLRPQGLGLFQNTSAPRQLRTFVLPVTRPQLVAPERLEVGTLEPVDCSLDGLFPSLEAQVHLELGEQRLNSITTYHEDSVSAKATIQVTAEQEGIQLLRCVVRLANQTRATHSTVTVYDFPGPNLTLSEPEVSEGNLVTVSCEAHAGAVVTLSDAQPGPPSSQVKFLINASAEDDGRLFSCSAALEVARKVLYKNRTLELRVLYGPRLDERDCLGNWTWQEGSQKTLRCQAWGNPAPLLSCTRKTDGALLPIGVVSFVKRELDGTYLCRAVSSRGEVTREVFLKVLWDNQNNLVIIIVVIIAALVSTLVLAAYLYNRQRKIKKYKIQKALEGATMKLNTQATPP